MAEPINLAEAKPPNERIAVTQGCGVCKNTLLSPNFWDQ